MTARDWVGGDHSSFNALSLLPTLTPPQEEEEEDDDDESDIDSDVESDIIELFAGDRAELKRVLVRVAI